MIFQTYWNNSFPLGDLKSRYVTDDNVDETMATFTLVRYIMTLQSPDYSGQQQGLK
tara:strand:+ start:181 stop:348 length:168 start_codon:yes stop_codon:yes gene_type:complete